MMGKRILKMALALNTGYILSLVLNGFINKYIGMVFFVSNIVILIMNWKEVEDDE